MKLKDLIRGFPELKVVGSKEIEITGITADSRTAAPGNLFIAKKGNVSDGAEFIAQAVEAGAAAVLSPIYNPFFKQTQILCEQPENWEAKFAARFYRKPSRDLWIAGVTGSKGKTTTTYLLRHLLTSLGRPCGLIGTVETILGEKRFFSTFTTHDPILNQKLLREMADNGCQAAALEISSIGMAQGRVEEIEFDLALFTNLYPDHLDYHKTVEVYAAEKKKLFERADFGIYNADCPWTSFMREGRKGLTFGIEAHADVRAEALCFHPEGGASFTIQGERFFTPFMGRFNVSNFLGAIAVGVHLNVDLARLAAIFAKTPFVPGRLEEIPNDRGIRVFVDYAHTGEALEKVLKTLREIARKRIIAVFGCGGGRDPARRTGMGAAGANWADLSIVTSDNPRNEDPQAICNQILAAFEGKKNVLLEIDREKAIRLAIQMAERDDLVLIAGKGHERMQTFAHHSIPFDDVAIAKQELQKRPSSAILSSS